MIRARRPTSSSTRSRISAAALLVNVIARIEPGCALRSEISQAIRRVSTRVLPEPAPATTSSGAPACTTAARCGSLSPSSSSSRLGPRPLPPPGRPDPSRGRAVCGVATSSSSSVWVEEGACGIGNDALMSGPAYVPAGTVRRTAQRPFAEKCMRSDTRGEVAAPGPAGGRERPGDHPAAQHHARAAPGPVEVGARQLGQHEVALPVGVQERVHVDREPVGVRGQRRCSRGWSGRRTPRCCSRRRWAGRRGPRW